MAALRRPVRSARAGHAGKGQNVPEKHRAHKTAQACRPCRQSGAAPACRAGGQRRLSPGRAVQCAYFSTAGPDIPDIPDKACFPCPGGGRAQKEIRAPYTCQMPQIKAGCTQPYSFVQPAFSCEKYSMRESGYRMGPFGFQNSLRQTGRRDAQGGGSPWTGMDERPSGKSTPQHKVRCRKKALPLKGNFCTQPLQIFLTGTKGICGKFPCFASKIAVSKVLCGFGRAALEEVCAKKFSKSDGLPGFLRMSGIKAASQNRWLRASTHLVQGAVFALCAARKKAAPRTLGARGRLVL